MDDGGPAAARAPARGVPRRLRPLPSHGCTVSGGLTMLPLTYPTECGTSTVVRPLTDAERLTEL
ncbi:hypothetical protein WLX13_23165, partial [Bordetella bronchiseptica]